MDGFKSKSRLISFLACLVLGLVVVFVGCSTPAPTPTAKPSPSPTTTPSPSPTAKPSPSPTATPSPTAKPASLKIRYHSVPTASGMYRVGVAIRQAVMADYPELDVTIISTSSVLERIELARAGTTDIFEVQYEALYRAHNGTEDFKGKEMTNGR
ncbi:MAG: hypothetical protein Q7R57_09505, partial [Dehalococcoidales bacterium]|nr:hypothetical protein [Dehalococcoidales bacterium]